MINLRVDLNDIVGTIRKVKLLIKKKGEILYVIRIKSICG